MIPCAIPTPPKLPSLPLNINCIYDPNYLPFFLNVIVLASIIAKNSNIFCKVEFASCLLFCLSSKVTTGFQVLNYTVTILVI